MAQPPPGANTQRVVPEFSLGGWPGFPTPGPQPALPRAARPNKKQAKANQQQGPPLQQPLFRKQSHGEANMAQGTSEGLAGEASGSQPQVGGQSRGPNLAKNNIENVKQGEPRKSKQGPKQDSKNRKQDAPQRVHRASASLTGLVATEPALQSPEKATVGGHAFNQPLSKAPHMAQSFQTTQVAQATQESQDSQEAQALSQLPAPDPSFATSQPIDYSEKYVEDMQLLVPLYKELAGEGYVLKTLTLEDLEMKKRCARCNKFANKPARKVFQDKERTRTPVAGLAQGSGSQPAGELPQGAAAEPSKPKEVLKCQFHPGEVRKKHWTCCREHVAKPGCSRTKNHELVSYRPGELGAKWQCYETPWPSSSQQVRPAVALDCEMGTATSGDSVLIRVSLMDYFTAEPLLDQLVLPTVPMQHYNTRFSGVTPRMMEEARRRNACLLGTEAARVHIWQFVDPHTLVVGHSLHNDLKALRWIHFRVIDSFILEPRPKLLESEKAGNKDGKGSSSAVGEGETEGEIKQSQEHTLKAAPGAGLESGQTAVKAEGEKPKPSRHKGDGPRSLKTLARVKLGRAIQDPARRGHDSVEDALASRDLVHWAVMDRRRKAMEQADFLLAATRRND